MHGYVRRTCRGCGEPAAPDGTCALCWFDMLATSRCGSCGRASVLDDKGNPACPSCDREPDLEEVIAHAMDSARTLAELEDIGRGVRETNLDEPARKRLRGVYAARRNVLRTHEVDLDGRLVPIAPAGPSVIVVAHEKVPALSKHGATAERVELVDAFTREWPTDAHFQPLSAPAGAPVARLSADSLPLLSAPPRVVALVLDVDGPAHGRTPEWDAEIVEGARKLPGRPFGYWTRGGARFVWRLDTPAPIDGWSVFYLDALARVKAVSGIAGDQGCTEWQRLYRLPHATRDGEPQRRGWICGHPAEIGTWNAPEVSESDQLFAMRKLNLAGSKREKLLGPRPDLRPPRPPPPPRPIGAGDTACSECGQGFQPRAAHHRRCLACFRVARIVEPVANAGAGTRNTALVHAAVAARRLVGDGMLDDGSRLTGARARHEIERAGRACGLPAKEIDDVIGRLGPGEG